MTERSATEQELSLMRPGVPSHIRRGWEMEKGKRMEPPDRLQSNLNPE